MKFFDFLYIHIFDWYSKHNRNGDGGSAMFILSGLYLFNIILLNFLYNLISEKMSDIPKIWIIVVYIVLCVFNYMRYIYYDEKIGSIRLLWAEQLDKKQKRYQLMMIVYGAVSFFMVIGMAIFLGNRNV